MNVIVEKQPQCRASMRVELSKEEVESERRQVVEAFRNQARIPGYRPGKTPLPVVEKRFQREITEELESRLVRQGCRDGIKKEALEVISITGIEEKTLHPDQTFSFTAQLQVAPHFELPSYEGIPVKLKPATVTDADVEREMDYLRQRMSRFNDLTDRPLQMGDFVVVSYSASLDGQPLSEAVEGSGFLASGESQWLRMSPDGFIPGFCENLAGLSAGSQKEFDLSVPEDFEVAALRGKTLHYQVTVVSVKEQVLPEWTDELASLLDKDLTVDGLRQRCRENLERHAENERAEEATTQILEFLDQNVDFELPDQVVAHETQRQVNQIVQRIQRHGMSPEQITGQKDAIIQHASSQAEVNVKTAFILRQIAEKEGIQTTERDLAVYCASLAHAAGTSVKSYVRQLHKSDGLEEVSDRIVRMKTLEFLRGKAVITEAEPEPAGDQASAEGGAERPASEPNP